MAKNIYVQRMREKRKQNNLCLACGKELDREGIYCLSCRDKINTDVKETRKWYQDNGICPRCRKNKLFGDEKNCPECTAYAYTMIMPKREQNREHYNETHAEWSRRKHQEMIEKGICTRCRKRKSDYGYKTCGICRNEGREYKRMKYGKPSRAERHTKGLCYFCDKPIKQGYKVCEEHYQRNVDMSRTEKAKKAREKMIREGILY